MAEAHGTSLPNAAAARRLRIGELLVERGVITREQAGRALQHSVERSLRFGEAALELGLLTAEQLEDALATQKSAAMATQLKMQTVAASGSVATGVFAFHDPEGDAAEDLRALRNALTLRWFQHPEGGRALSVISPSRGDGRSLVASNLAVSFAQVGVRTLLIDADMRHPRLHELFALDNAKGLTGYLNGRLEDAAHYYVEGLEKLTVIPVGALPPSPQELLLRPALETLLETASVNFEVVIVDTPAAAIGTDYQIVARATRGALMVAHQRTTRTRQSARILNLCEEVGVKVVGGTMLLGESEDAPRRRRWYDRLRRRV